MFGSWNIYTVGDVSFFEQILIGVAMVTGTNDFVRAASIGLLFSLLMIFFQSLSKGLRELNYQQALMGWIVYMCLFVPSTTVVLEDSVTGEVRVVANVPLGVGVAGGMISSIGHGLTELFEQGYAFTAGSDLQNRQFAEPLYVLNQVHRVTKDPVLLAELSQNVGPHANLKQSWDNYIRECTLRKVELNIASLERIEREPLRQSLKFDSPVYHTRIYDGSVGGRNLSCAEAYDVLMSVQDTAWNSLDVQRKLAYLMGIDNPKNPTYQEATSAINDAFQMVGLVHTTAANYLNSTLLQPIFYKAIQGKLNNENDIGNALMVNQATAQRNVQWMAEKTMFATTIRPLQTFFEGFIYAVSPIIGILLATGTFGISLAFKYMITLLWIQLWKPILSIANLYIVTAASGALSAYDDENFGSIYSMQGMYESISHWLGVGGMMAAATPMLALMLVTGSTYAMTSIAGRISGADHINEKIRVPDALKDAPVVKGVALAQSDHLVGTSSVHADKALGTIEIGSALSTSVASSEAKMYDATQAFQKQLQRVADSTGTGTWSSGFTQEIGQSVMSGNTRQSEIARSLHQKLTSDYGYDSTTASQYVGQWAMGGGAKAGVSAKVVGVNTGVDAKATTQTSASTSAKATTMDALARDLGWSEKDSSSLTEQLASRIAGNSSFASTHSMSDKAAKALSDSASEVISSSKSYREATELAQRFGSSDKISIHDVAGRLGDMRYVNSSPAVQSAYNDLGEFFRMNASPRMRDEAQELGNMYLNAYGMEPKRASMAGMLKAMSRPENYAPGEADAGMLALASIISRVQTGQDVGMRDHAMTSNALDMLERPNFAPGSIRGEVGNAVAPAAGLGIGNHDARARDAYDGAFNRFQEVASSSSTQANQDYVRVLGTHQMGFLDDKAISEFQEKARSSRLELENRMSNTEISVPVGMQAFSLANNMKSLVDNGLVGAKFAENMQSLLSSGESDGNVYRDHAPHIFNQLSKEFQATQKLHEPQANYLAATALGMDREAKQYAGQLFDLHGDMAPKVIEHLDAAALNASGSKAYLAPIQQWNHLYSIENTPNPGAVDVPWGLTGDSILTSNSKVNDGLFNNPAFIPGRADETTDMSHFDRDQFLNMKYQDDGIRGVASLKQGDSMLLNRTADTATGPVPGSPNAATLQQPSVAQPVQVVDPVQPQYVAPMNTGPAPAHHDQLAGNMSGPTPHVSGVQIAQVGGDVTPPPETIFSNNNAAPPPRRMVDHGGTARGGSSGEKGKGRSDTKRKPYADQLG